MSLAETLRKYRWIGIRTTADDEHYNVGDTCRASYEWDYDNDCSTYNTENPIQLSGTCAVHIDIEDKTDDEIMELINEAAGNYSGEQTIVIGGDYKVWGSDESEIIIEDAEVLVVL